MPVDSHAPHTLHSGGFTIRRLRQDSAAHAEFVQPEPDDGYTLMLKLRPAHSFALYVGDERQLHVRDTPGEPGSLCLLPRDAGIRLELDAPFDMIHFAFPQRALEQAAGELGLPPPGRLRPPPPGSHDAAVTALGSALLPSLERPARASVPFVAHTTMALAAHLLHAYGSVAAGAVRGGLAPWQEQRAKELLRANLAGAPGIAAIAAACRLSPGHFATAFKRTTGCTPTAWLTGQRIDHARALLRQDGLPLAAIAAASGFADQAHFTRAFTREVGMPPGAWRRLQ